MLGLSAALLACEPATENNTDVATSANSAAAARALGPPLAKIDGKPLPNAVFEHYRALQSEQSKTLRADEALVSELIDLELMAQAAYRHKLAQQPAVAGELYYQRHKILARAMVDQYLKDHPVTDAELEAAYEDRYFHRQRVEYHARHILVATEKQAKAILQELKAGGDFTTLARRHSKDPAAAAGGALDWFTQDDVVPEFYQAISALRKGQTTPAPVKTRYGWHIIELEDFRKVPAPDFALVRDSLKSALEQERVTAYMQQLRDQAAIEILK